MKHPGEGDLGHGSSRMNVYENGDSIRVRQKLGQRFPVSTNASFPLTHE
jgi:hypothetical protein